MYYSDDLWAAQMVRETVIRAVEGVANEMALVALFMRKEAEKGKEPPPTLKSMSGPGRKGQ